jgi:hypothetical protein
MTRPSGSVTGSALTWYSRIARTTSLNGADPATTTTVRVITSATVRVIVGTSCGRDLVRARPRHPRTAEARHEGSSDPP